MSNKFSKTVTTSSHQKTTRTTETTRIVSSTQTSTSGYVSPYRSSTNANKPIGTTAVSTTEYVSPYRPSTIANRPIGTTAVSTTKTYQPVYNQPRRSEASSSFTRNTPEYRSLQSKPPSYTNDATATAAGSLFYSFGTAGDRNRSMSTSQVNNNERTSAVPGNSWRIPPLATPAASVSYAVAQDARPYRSVSSPAIPRSTSSTLGRYDLRKQAYVLIFHHLFKKDKTLFRKGSELDLMLICDFFQGYNAKIADICEDFTVAKVKKKMNDVRTKNFSSYSCLIIIIMSHGELNDQIQALDGFYHLDNAIVEPALMNDSLKGKPKLFFVQACKGNALMESDARPTSTNKFDILKCFSTYEGTLSIRYTTAGTTFIQTLFELIRLNGDKEIIDIMRLMRSTFSDNRVQQAPTETSTLTKQFYFHDLKK